MAASSGQVLVRTAAMTSTPRWHPSYDPNVSPGLGGSNTAAEA